MGSTEPGGSRAAASALRIAIDGEHWLLPIERVEAVIVPAAISPVPSAPPELVGLLNVRGAIVVAFEIAPPAPARRHAAIVRLTRGGHAAILCDWAEDIVDADPAARPIDVDALADAVATALATATPSLSRPPIPAAWVHLRRR